MSCANRIVVVQKCGICETGRGGQSWAKGRILQHQDSGNQESGLRIQDIGINCRTIYQENENLLSVNERKLYPKFAPFQLSPVE